MDEWQGMMRSAETTEALGEALGRWSVAGDVVHLEGDLGAGKTTFTRGFVRGLDLPDPREVASPTYAIHHRYEGGRAVIDHLDLYRIDDVASAGRQGLLDPILEPEGVTLVEWSERLGDEAPPPRWRVQLEVVDLETRQVRVTGEGAQALGERFA